MEWIKDEVMYRISTWEDTTRQEREFTVITSSIYEGDDWKELKGFDELEEAIKYVEGVLL